MMRATGLRSTGVWWLLGLAAGFAGPARADGTFIPGRQVGPRAPVSAPGQKAVILRDGPGHEILVLQTTYRGPADRFAWVIPVPGRPERDDFFLANPATLAKLDQWARPWLDGRLIDPVARTPRTMGRLAGSAPSGRFVGPRVALHAQMALGEYQVSILSATGPGVLQGWLAANGYAFPKEGAAVIDRYVARHWSFVALKARPEVARAGTLLGDMQPIGIRFPTRKLVYPLTISRIGARPTTTLSLTLFDAQGMQCDTLPEVTLPEFTRGRPGETYWMMAHQALQQHAGRAFLCESRELLPPLEIGSLRRSEPAAAPGRAEAGRPSVPLAPRTGEAAAPPREPGAEVPWTHLVATRLWAELPVDAMADLEFTPAGSSVWAHVSKRATMPAPWAARVLASGWGCALLLPVVFLLALLGSRPYGEAPKASPEALRRVSRPSVRWLAVALVLGAVGSLPERAAYPLVIPLLALHVGLLQLPAAAGVLYQLLLCGWIGIAVLLSIRLGRMVPRAVARRASAWSAVLLIAALGARDVLIDRTWLLESSDRPVPPLSLLTLAALGLFCWLASLELAFAVPGTAGREGKSRTLGAALLATLLAVPFVGNLRQTAVDLVWPERYRMASLLDERLGIIEKGLAQFRERTGASPRRLSDLTATHLPPTGLDASGNEVPIPGALSGPILPALPVDPLTGRRDTWVYDPLSPNPVDSGAFIWSVQCSAG